MLRSLSKYRLLLSFAITLIAGLIALVFVVDARWSAHHAAGPLRKYQEFRLEKGSGLNILSSRLEEEGVIDDAFSFRLIARLQGVGQRLKAGDYRFPRKISPAQVLEMLVEGNTQLYSITIPEGLTSQQILGRLQKAKRLSGQTPKSLPEASILPETYHFENGMAREDLIAIMQADWKEAVQVLWNRRREGYPLQSLEEVLVLASIVEKEAVREAEMPTIAGVFFNRLERNMKLQSDPTVIYAVSGGLGKMNRRLLRKDWKFPHDHNTYYRKGLPPTAIAHPGLAAVRATLNPKKTDNIFFVADGRGGHRFAVTLKEHRENIAKLNILRKEVRK